MARYAETVRRIIHGDFDNASDEEKKEAIADVKKACSVGAAAVALQPLPLLDVALISPIQIAMVQAIGRIYGYKLDTRSVIEILSTFGTSILAQNAIMASCKLIPFAGWVLGVSMAYALTYAVGEVADYYFASGRGASSSELKQMFKEIYERKKKEKQAEHAGGSTLKEKLEQLQQAFEAGHLTQEQYDKKKEELLASF